MGDYSKQFRSDNRLGTRLGRARPARSENFQVFQSREQANQYNAESRTPSRKQIKSDSGSNYIKHTTEGSTSRRLKDIATIKRLIKGGRKLKATKDDDKISQTPAS